MVVVVTGAGVVYYLNSQKDKDFKKIGTTSPTGEGPGAAVGQNGEKADGSVRKKKKKAKKARKEGEKEDGGVAAAAAKEDGGKVGTYSLDRVVIRRLGSIEADFIGFG